MKLWGWVLFYIGGIGSVVSAGFGSGWLLYTFIVSASSGVVLITYTTQRDRKNRERTVTNSQVSSKKQQ